MLSTRVAEYPGDSEDHRRQEDDESQSDQHDDQLPQKIASQPARLSLRVDHHTPREVCSRSRPPASASRPVDRIERRSRTAVTGRWPCGTELRDRPAVHWDGLEPARSVWQLFHDEGRGFDVLLGLIGVRGVVGLDIRLWREPGAAGGEHPGATVEAVAGHGALGYLQHGRGLPHLSLIHISEPTRPY